jgi:hypothetical protein
VRKPVLTPLPTSERGVNTMHRPSLRSKLGILTIALVGLTISYPTQAKDTDRQVGDAKASSAEKDLDQLVRQEVKEFEEALREYNLDPTIENYEKAFHEVDDFRDMRLNYDLTEKQDRQISKSVNNADWDGKGYPP